MALLAALKKTDLLAVKGVRLASAYAGLKPNQQADIALIELTKGSQLAAVYTQNQFCAAPIIVAKQHQQENADTRLCLINAGNANAGTGQAGITAAKHCCQQLAQQYDIDGSQVLPFSTGVIGQALPDEKIIATFPTLLTALSTTHWYEAAQAIKTTDTQAKGISVQVTIGGQLVTVTGIAKGSGMIQPDMATMLAYIATDAAVSQPVLQQILACAVKTSFNRICVDGDTSTNDACVLIATAKVAMETITTMDDDAGQQLYQAIVEVCQYLAKAIVRDGEGATKFVTITVTEGESAQECHQLANLLAQSPLVKTALFASDPNWGRILAVVGRSGIDNLELSNVSIYLDDVKLIHHGEPDSDYSEQAGQTVMAKEDILIKVELGRGQAEETVWTCDLSYDYIKINAEYRT